MKFFNGRFSPTWPKVLGAAALSSAATLFVARNFFQTEKKIRHRIISDYEVGDEDFQRTMGQLLGPPFLEGNRITILRNGEQIFPAMLAAIRSAKRTITFENFLMKEGTLSDRFAEALAERARAGVKVHFLQDAMGCDCVHGRAIDLLEEAGVEVEVYRLLHIVNLNCRTHRKLLIIDGKMGFIGGVGIADDWDGDGRTAGKWRDNHYQVEGPAAAQLQWAFTDNWMQTRARVLHGNEYFPGPGPVGDTVCQVFISSSGEGADSARLMILLSVAAARRNIRIANAYFIPDDLCRQTLIEACQRGVKVEIITPGPDIDAQSVRAVGKTRWRPLLEAGAHFYEFMPARYHSKYMIVDDCWTSVGSANFDTRSLRLNEEANLNVLDQKFAAEHTAIFDEDKSLSRRVTLEDWRNRPWQEKVRGRAWLFMRAQL